MDASIVYYTSNRERQAFEAAIFSQLVQSSDDLPIITVSHKPMSVSNNICVGDVGQSNVNIFRQMMIGVEAAKTPYIFTAEADQIHPPEFFNFRPIRTDTMYAGMPFYILSARHGKRRVFCEKERGCEGAMVASRELVLRLLQKMLKGQPEWMDSPGRDAVKLPFIFNMGRKETFTLHKAIISFRTDRQLHRATPYKPRNELRELPYWGSANDLITKYTGRS